METPGSIAEAREQLQKLLDEPVPPITEIFRHVSRFPLGSFPRCSDDAALSSFEVLEIFVNHFQLLIADSQGKG